MSDALYYERPVLLDRERHRRLRLARSSEFGFAGKANSVVAAGAEFNEAMKEYAIVFRRDAAGEVSPVLMLGLRERENLFVGDGGAWDARYVPAFVRRYPFVLARLGGAGLGVCVDEAYPGFDGKEGELLFDGDGGNSRVLADAIDFLTAWQREFMRTAQFCRRLQEHGLLRAFDAKADLKDGRSFTVSGLLVVDEPRLMALPDAVALSLFRSGELHLVSMHLVSLSNMNRLVDRLASRPAPFNPPPRPA